VRRLSALPVVIALLLVVPAAQATLVFNKLSAHGSHWSVWSASDDGSNAKKIAADGLSPRISPDGLTVAYQSVYGQLGTRPQLLTVPTAGGKRSILLDPQWDPDTMAWSPDSKTIAAVTGHEVGTKRLVLIDVATGNSRTVASGEFYGVGFSPTGGAIVYARAAKDGFPPRSSLWVAPVDGGNPVKITSGHPDVSPAWGPQAIVFARQRKPPRRYDAWKQDLYLLAPGGMPKRLTFQKPSFLLYGLSPVSLSADGTRLLAQFGGQDTAFAQTVDPVTGKVRTVGLQSDGIVGSALSHDGTTILATQGEFEDPSNRTNVVTVPYDGGRPHVLVRHALSPDWNR
jgi:Tol biopolymer transport system component